MAFMFEKLEVYQKAVDFAEQVISLTEQFTKGYYFLSDQLNIAFSGKFDILLVMMPVPETGEFNQNIAYRCKKWQSLQK
jgi:hypothetical protein